MALQPQDLGSLALLALAALVILFGSKEIVRFARMVQEALDNFTGRGPGPPMHPMPADDRVLLLRRRKQPGN